MPGGDDLPVHAFASQAEFEAWLEAEHETAPGLWVRIAKKASGIPTVSPAEAIESCLCFGWIDGKRIAHDEATFLQRYTPRRSRSKWSKINRDTALRLIDEGRMRPRGLAEMRRAQEDGRWDAAYDSPRTMEVPADLRAALGADPKAAEAFAGLSGTNRYAILFRIHDAKRAETRERRIRQFVEMLARGETLY
jgi:uncharacterized protein YdeI (YjbR/CyaY-like superfamily)